MLSIIRNYPLHSLNTFGMTVHAAYFSELNEEDDVYYLEDKKPNGHDLLVLGGGSNILFTENPAYWVLHNKLKGISVISEDDEYVWLRASAGEQWHDFVLYCVRHNYGGVENLSLIPGTVGAAPIQNIGAYGTELKDVLDEVTFWDITSRCFRTFDNRACCLGYRNSIFKQELKGKIIITSVVFRLNKMPKFNTSYGTIQQELERMGITELSIQNISEAVIRIRQSKLPDPKTIGNAGSFFKNPEIDNAFFEVLKQSYPDMPGYVVSDTVTKVPAAWLIEQCGWKGFREDDYGVHAQQALVLVNYGNAKGKDIALLSEHIMQSVKEKFGIMLEREVQLV